MNLLRSLNNDIIIFLLQEQRGRMRKLEPWIYHFFFCVTSFAASNKQTELSITCSNSFRVVYDKISFSAAMKGETSSIVDKSIYFSFVSGEIFPLLFVTHESLSYTAKRRVTDKEQPKKKHV